MKFHSKASHFHLANPFIQRYILLPRRNHSGRGGDIIHGK
nr:MAG TPA: hypothetical protein [Caudoviricetes sp.]